MRASRIRLGARGLGALALITLPGCGYQSLQRQDAMVQSAWSEIVGRYQEREAIAPDLIGVVKGYAPREAALLDGVSAADAKVRTIPVGPASIDDPRLLDAFQVAQNDLSSALSRLIAIADKYPDLKSDQNFRDEQSLLEASEVRIAGAHRRYADAVQSYNRGMRTFPAKLTAAVLGFKPKADFAVSNQATVARPDAAPQGR